jgi:ribonuclease P protein component
VQDKRYSFTRNQRLIKPAEYQEVFKQQKKIYSQGLVVYYYENLGPHTRLGLAVAKRYFKKAVDRNRIKRKIRESFRMQKELGNKDVIVVATSKLREHKPCQISSSLNEIWKKLSVTSSPTP